jgi:glycosyltransferase involved in cell wall biosynthesis
MRAVVITHLPPPDPVKDRHGVYRRLGLFVQGIGRVCQDVEIVHIAREDHISTEDRISTEKSEHSRDRLNEYWATPVATRSIPADEAPRVLWQAAHAVFHVRYRGGYRPLLGSAQAQALRTILADRPDVIFAHRLPAMAAVLRLGEGASPVFFDLDDVEHRVRLRAAGSAHSSFERWRRFAEVPALMRTERRALRMAARSFVCSDIDRDYLASRGYDVERTRVIANSVPVPEHPVPLPQCKTILFLGNYGYPPNAEAAERLIASIWPKVRTRIQGARLIVAGDHPERIPSFGAAPSDVEFPGFVSELDALYTRTRLVCSPIGNGGGTRVKLIEAAGFGRPIVATPLAAEGLSLEHGRDILLFQADSDLAAACVALLENDDEARALGQSARRKAQSLYSFDQTRDQIADELRNWFANKRGRSDGAAFMGFKPKAHRVETGSDCPSVPSSLEQR